MDHKQLATQLYDNVIMTLHQPEMIGALWPKISNDLSHVMADDSLNEFTKYLETTNTDFGYDPISLVNFVSNFKFYYSDNVFENIAVLLLKPLNTPKRVLVDSLSNQIYKWLQILNNDLIPDAPEYLDILESKLAVAGELVDDDVFKLPGGDAPIYEFMRTYCPLDAVLDVTIYDPMLLYKVFTFFNDMVSFGSILEGILVVDNTLTKTQEFYVDGRLVISVVDKVPHVHVSGDVFNSILCEPILGDIYEFLCYWYELTIVNLLPEQHKYMAYFDSHDFKSVEELHFYAVIVLEMTSIHVAAVEKKLLSVPEEEKIKVAKALYKQIQEFESRLDDA